MRDDVVRCSHLVKVYDSPTGRVQALRGVDIGVARGEVTAVVGPSGSGKSSLLRIMSGLDRPTAGDVVVGETSLGSLSNRRLRRFRASAVSHVLQRPADNLMEHLATFEQVDRMARSRGGSAADSLAMLEIVGLSEVLERRPHELSGGEQQRLAFARGAVAGPEIVIADEPTAELDTASADEVIGAMRRLVDGHTSVIVATHDPRVIRRADTIVSLHDGAVASVNIAGTDLTAIDGAGRIQLPEHVRGWFPDNRASLVIDEGGRWIRIEPT